jgi:hypothetical protein
MSEPVRVLDLVRAVTAAVEPGDAVLYSRLLHEIDRHPVHMTHGTYRIDVARWGGALHVQVHNGSKCPAVRSVWPSPSGNSSSYKYTKQSGSGSEVTKYNFTLDLTRLHTTPALLNAILVHVLPKRITQATAAAEPDQHNDFESWASEFPLYGAVTVNVRDQSLHVSYRHRTLQVAYKNSPYLLEFSLLGTPAHALEVRVNEIPAGRSTDSRPLLVLQLHDINTQLSDCRTKADFLRILLGLQYREKPVLDYLCRAAASKSVHAAAEPEPKPDQGEELVRRLEQVFYALAEGLRKKPNIVMKLGSLSVRLSLRPDHGFRDPEIVLNGPFSLRLICPSLSGYSQVPKLFLMDADDDFVSSVPFNVGDSLNRKFLNRILLAYQKACLARSRWNLSSRGGPVPAPPPPGRFRPGHGRPR